MVKNSVIAVVGPTASGKSALAVKIARHCNGEIISADSRQVYRGLDIGTGKITKKEMMGIPHHLLDVASPKRQFTAAEFKKKAKTVIRRIHKNGKVPIIVGGTGFWIDSLLFGLSLPDVPPNKKLRRALSQKSAHDLFVMLRALDPKRAKSIDRDNPRRLIRAIEIASALGRVPPLKMSAPYHTLWIGITRSPRELKKRIRARLAARVRHGLFAEGRKLRRQGLSWKRFYELGLEYRYITDFLQHKQSKKGAIHDLEQAIQNYAKRQITWFRKNPRIQWIQKESEATILAADFLNLHSYHSIDNS